MAASNLEVLSDKLGCLQTSHELSWAIDAVRLLCNASATGAQSEIQSTLCTLCTSNLPAPRILQYKAHTSSFAVRRTVSLQQVRTFRSQLSQRPTWHAYNLISIAFVLIKRLIALNCVESIMRKVCIRMLNALLAFTLRRPGRS